MKAFVVLLKREFQRIFLLPQSYAIAGAFFVLSGVFLISTVIANENPDMGQYFARGVFSIIVLAPVVAMRSFAEERASGALTIALSWPVSRWAIVLSKFISNTVYSWALVSIAWLYVRLLSQISGINMSRAAGGYIGMLFLVAAFSALALMVSAWAASPASAAFLGFGLLFFLWILQFAPNWIGFVNKYGPDNHLRQFYQGAIFLGDCMYFVLLVVVGLGVSVYVLNRARPGLSRNRGAEATVFAAITIAAMGFIPPITSKIHSEYDLTGGHSNTVTQVTKKIVKSIHVPIHITAYVNTLTNEEAQVKNVVQQYQAAGANMKLTIVDPNVQPGKAEANGVTNAGVYDIEINGHHEMIPDVNEIDVTTAIRQLAEARRPVFCFTNGHGERLLSDSGPGGIQSLASQLANLGFQSQNVAIGAPGGARELAGCSELAVIGPQQGFLPEELTAIQDYLKHDGRLTVAADGYNTPIKQLNQLTAPIGLQFGAEVVHDQESVAGDDASVVTSNYPSTHPAVADLQSNNTSVVMPLTLSVEKTGAAALSGRNGQGGSGGFVSYLVKSSDHSWTVNANGVVDQHGPFYLAAAADQTTVTNDASGQPVQHGTRVILLGSANVAANRYTDVMGDANLASGSLQWTGLANDIVTAIRPVSAGYKLLITGSQKTNLTVKAVVFPTLAALIFFPVTFLRLKRG